LWNTPEAVYRGPLLPTNLPPAQLKQILGVEGCLWTERVASVPALEFMLLPRMMALAEMAWTPDERRDFAQFSIRLKPQLEQYRRQGIYFYDANKPQPLRQMGEGFLRATNSLQSASTP
jgi:hexosaminidase